MTHVPMRILTLLSAVLLLLGTLATPVLAGPGGRAHYCEAANGVVLVQRGTARCSASAGSYARASGKNAEARGDSGGTAIAEGNESMATAHVGYAQVIGDHSIAQAVDWYSIAEVRGNNSKATAVNGSTAKVDGNFSIAAAGGTGSEAYAVGDYSSASAVYGCSITSGPGQTLSCS